MTLPSPINRNDYVGTGIATVFSYTFRIIAASDLRVLLKTGSAAPVLQVLTTNYTVDGIGNSLGGNVTFVVAPPLNTKIIIKRTRPITQETDIRNQGPYRPELHEDEFDDQTMIDQMLQEQIDRSFKIPEDEIGSALLTEFPSIDQRRGQLMGFDAVTGGPIARAEGPAPGEVLWTVRGNISLGDNPFPRYTAIKDITFAKFDITAVGLGVGGDTVLEIVKEGGIVTTVTLPAGVKFATVSLNIPLVSGDEIYPAWQSIAPTTPPSTVTIAFRT